MKISYVTIYDALNIRNWSGLGYNIANALEEQNADIDYVGNLQRPLNLKHQIKRIFLKGVGSLPLGDRTPFVARHLSETAEKRLKLDTDVIFSPGSLPIAFMSNKIPKVFYTDATFAGMVDFYPDYSRFSAATIRAGNYIEQKALDNCTQAIYSSDWAAETALRFYKVNSNKLSVVPFGANMPTQNEFSDIQRIVKGRSREVCRLLFLSVEWERKGGNLALEIVDHLNKMGIKAELHIAGIKKLPVKELSNLIINHGFISKSTAEGIDRLEHLMCASHFLLLPTKADCSPVVFSEASSFGLPSISTNLGGIPTIIKDDVNGKMFSIYEKPALYAEYIKNSFLNFSGYEKFCYSSFSQYKERLNWTVAGKKVMDLLHKSYSGNQNVYT